MEERSELNEIRVCKVEKNREETAVERMKAAKCLLCVRANGHTYIEAHA